MSNQNELVYKILQKLEKAGVLRYLIVIGSWCIYFYKHHFKEAELLPPIRTRDIEFDVSQLKKSGREVNIGQILEDLGFIIDFQASEGFIRFVHQDIIVEFLVPEKGKGQDAPYALPGYGINVQPIRFLNFLEEETITVNYKNLSIQVPEPAAFAVHKLIISQRRPHKSAAKSENDIRQALAVWDMLLETGKEKKIKEILSQIPKGWLKLVKKALGKANKLDRVNFL